MNQVTLAHHTAITDWCIWSKLKQEPYRSGAFIQNDSYKMTAEKYDSVSKWCTNVNELFIRPVKKESPALFRRFRVSNATFAHKKSTTQPICKTVSACYANTIKMGASSAILSGRAKVAGKSINGQEINGHCVHILLGNATSAKMDDVARFHKEEEKTVYLKIQPERKQKLSTGWTINRPMLYSAHLSLTSQLSPETETKEPILSQMASTTMADSIGTECYTNLIDSKWATKDMTFHISHVHSCELESAEESEQEQATKEDDKWISQATNPVILDRSTSNSILNVLSVDDCRMSMRYRPTRVVLSQQDMMVSRPLHTDEEDSSNVNVCAAAKHQQADHTPFRVSRVSGQTTLSPSTSQPHVAYNQKPYHKHMGLATTEDVLCSSSAAVERAFDEMLGKTFSTRSVDRPHTNRHHNLLNRAHSVCHGQTRRFGQLNHFLRESMWKFVESRRHKTVKT